MASGVASQAQGLIRDAEIERTLKFVMQPLLKASGTSGSRVKLFVVNDRSMNAFVAGGSKIFIHSGLIQRLTSVEMLQAVLAHELGHITGGHLSQRAVQAGSLNTALGLGLLLGAAAAAAGGGAGVAIGAQEAVRRSMLGFTRAQEASADESAVRYMVAAGINPQAGVDVLNIFRGQEILSVGRQDPYVLSHPLNSQRLARMRSYAQAYKDKPSTQVAGVNYWYARMIAKFDGFIGNPSRNLRRLKKSDTSEIATLTRAIAYHRLPKPKKAVSYATKLTQMRPKDPYYHELRGQILLENGNAAAAVGSYRRAAKLAPKEPLILAGLGRALLGVNSSSANKEALGVLKKAYARDPLDGRMLRDLGLAYARAGQNGMASVVTAERYALQSNFKQAELHATRAQKLLPRGSVGWLKADDILGAAKKVKRRK
ncbi:MAG: M48 family metalloprotease [Rhodobacteraceae bacterium]|nr:M48 family metalloprotease [Paracoccaceae bacterium]